MLTSTGSRGLFGQGERSPVLSELTYRYRCLRTTLRIGRVNGWMQGLVLFSPVQLEWLFGQAVKFGRSR